MTQIEKLKNTFLDTFGPSDQDIHSFFSPSRINIIGEHIDYNGGEVFPCPLEIGTYGLARKNDDQLLRLKSLNLEAQANIKIQDISYQEDHDWMNYVTGMVKYIGEAGYQVGGFDLLVYGNIPNGAGLSSSASLEMLVGMVLSVLYNGGNIDKKEMALLGQKTENDFFGLQTGIMDQFIIALGQKNHATLINTNELSYEHVPFDLADYALVILNTNKRRELKDSKYNERRSECNQALAILKEEKTDINYLCDLGQDDLELLNKIKDPKIKNRALHVIMENVRVKQAVDALNQGDIQKLGQLLVASNDSLRDLYEVTGPHLDSITKHANSFDACLGARMTGAGFGGCGIAIVKKDRIDEFVDHVRVAYKEDTGLDCQFIQSDIGDGVREII